MDFGIAESSGEFIREDLDKVFDLLVDKCEFLIRRLRDFVAFPTISSDPSKMVHIHEMADYLVEILKKFGFKPFIVPMTFEEVDPNDPPPPLVLAQTQLNPGKRTVCFYGHFDARPITMQDYWYSDPFVLTGSTDGTLYYGKGTSVGKGPILCLINAIGAYQQLGIPLPINVKLVLDPMGTTDEELTGKFLRKTSLEFFANVDFVCMCVGQWFGNVKPCVSHGSRGLCYFSMEIEGANKDLHSGCYGGLINEPMTDLVYMLNQLVDKRGLIKIPDIYEDIIPVTKEEKDYYKTIQFEVREFKQDIGAQELLANEDKKTLLINLWRMPSLTIHGIEGAFSQPLTKNIIPCKVTGKFSIHIVSNMTPSNVKKKVFDYLNKVWKTRKSTNRIRVQMTIGKQAWYTDPNDANCIAAVNAVSRVYDEVPELVRQSNRVRMANTLRRVTNASVIGVPVGKANDISESATEKIDLINYINGCKTFAAYIHEISQLSPVVVPQEKKVCSCKETGATDCICYMKSVWMIEEEEYDPSLEDSLAITSADMEFFSGRERVEEPASTRYFTCSSRVKNKIQALQNIIAEGETIIGLKLEKDMVDAVEQMEEEESGSIHVVNTVQHEGTSAATSQGQPAARSIQISADNDSVRVQTGRGDKNTQSIQPSNADTAIVTDSSYFSKPKAKKIVSMDLTATELEVQSLSLKALESGTQKPALSPTELTYGIKSGPLSLTAVEKGLVAVSSHGEKMPPNEQIVNTSTGVIPQGYVGKKPFNLKNMSSKQLEAEPYGIISSLSALLYKRRVEKSEGASVRSLPGSRMIEQSNVIQSVGTLKQTSSNQGLLKSNSSRHLDRSADHIDKESPKVHQIFMNLDQPNTSKHEIPRKKSHSSDKLRIQRKSLPAQNLS